MNDFQVASAAEVASRLPFPAKPLHGKWQTRGLCHGSGDKPDSTSLVFSDNKREGMSLDVHCFSCQPRGPADYDRIRHALQDVTGLSLCRCDACWQARGRTGAHRAGKPRRGGHRLPAAVPSGARSAQGGQERGQERTDGATGAEGPTGPETAHRAAQGRTGGDTSDYAESYGVQVDVKRLPDGNDAADLARRVRTGGLIRWHTATRT